MELLDFYAKILPDKLFEEERKKRQQKWHGQEYATLHGTDLSQLDQESDRLNSSLSGLDSACVESGAYSTIMGCHVPVRQQSKQPLIERFVGDDPMSRFQRKKEVVNMFRPEEGVRQNNISVNTDQLRNRFHTTDRTNDGIIGGKRVGRGLGTTDDGQRGLHPLLRVLPRNVDSIRGWINSKKTYGNIQKVGQLGSNGTVLIGRTEKRTADTFTDRSDLTTRVRDSRYTAEKSEGVHRNDPTQRSLGSKQITGPVKALDKHSQNRIDFLPEETTRNEYRDLDPMLVTGTNKNHRLVDNVLMQDTQRASTTAVQSTVAGISSGGKNSTKAINYYDIPKDTSRQTAPTPPVLNMSSIVRQTPQYSMVEPFTTGRNTTSENNHRGTASAAQGGKHNTYNPNQQPRDTLKVTTTLNPSDLYGAASKTQGGQSTAYDPLTEVRNTLKGTLPINPTAPQQMHVAAGPAITENMTLRDTLRNTEAKRETAGIQRGVALPPAKNYFEDVPRETLRQTTTTSQFTLGGNVAGDSKRLSTAVDFSMLPRETLRQTIVENNNLGILSGIPAGKKFTENLGDSTKPDTQRNITEQQDTRTGILTQNTAGLRLPESLPRDLGMRQTIDAISVPEERNLHGGIQESYTVSHDFEVRPSAREAIQSIPKGHNPAWRLEAQGHGYIATGVQAKETQRQSITSPSMPQAGARHAVSSGHTQVDRDAIQLNEARNQQFQLIAERPQTKIGNAAFPNRSTVVGNDILLKPDGHIIEKREWTPVHTVYEIPSFTNQKTTVVQDREPQRLWTRIQDDSEQRFQN